VPDASQSGACGTGPRHEPDVAALSLIWFESLPFIQQVPSL